MNNKDYKRISGTLKLVSLTNYYPRTRNFMAKLLVLFIAAWQSSRVNKQNKYHYYSQNKIFWWLDLNLTQDDIKSFQN